MLTISHYPENSDPTAIQRWRCMNVEAVFQMNDGIDSQLNDELITELECMLNVAFLPRLSRDRQSKVKPKTTYESIIRGEQEALWDIILQARKLSYMIQHEIVSCQLLVTISPATQTSSDGDTSTDDVLSTYAFGLQRISGSTRSILIKTKVITSETLQQLQSISS